MDRSTEEETTTTTTMLRNNNTSSSIKRRYQGFMLFHSVLLISLTYLIASTLYQFPLFPLQSDSLEWSVAWLVTSVVDFYGVTLCFGAIVLSSELVWWHGVAWTVGFCVLGSPICCLWILCWTYKGRTLTLPQTTLSSR
mmetsp:Transcript_58706/g.63359  ORF Transcript_58706/g.63359 Transcript_58706/m.63359 type:complete len:139 (-) Transcript_58706:141-557(-)